MSDTSDTSTLSEYEMGGLSIGEPDGDSPDKAESGADGSQDDGSATQSEYIGITRDDDHPSRINNIRIRQGQSYPDKPEGNTITAVSLLRPGVLGTLRSTADKLAAAREEIPEEVRDQLWEWGDAHGLIDGGELNWTAIARQAVFAQYLKFWIHRGTVGYKEYRDMRPSEIRAELQDAIDSVDSLVVTRTVLDDFVDEAATDILPTIGAIHWPMTPAHDMWRQLGRVYESLLSNEARHRLGQFWTPSTIGNAMQVWVTAEATHILDPGVGAAELSTPPRQTAGPDAVTGIDVDPVATLLGAAVLVHEDVTATVEAEDFFSLTAENIDIDGIVCNPPYTRARALSTSRRERLNDQIASETGREISSHSPLSAYFLYHARTVLSPEDRAAFLLRQNFLASEYGETLKAFLLEEFSVEALVRFDPEGESVFDTAATTAVAVFVSVQDDADSPDEQGGLTRFIDVDTEEIGLTFEPETVCDAVEAEQSGSMNWGSINCVSQAALNPAENWETLFGGADDCPVALQGLPALGEFVEVHRGPTTGASDVFRLSESERRTYGIDRAQCAKYVDSTAALDSTLLSEAAWTTLQAADEPVWLLTPDPDHLTAVPDDLDAVPAEADGGMTDSDVSNTAAYLRRSVETHGLRDVRALQKREPWYEMRSDRSARVLVTDEGRQFPFILNEAGVRHTNGTHGLHDIQLDDTELKALLAYLNSGLGRTAVSRRTKTDQGGVESLGVSKLAQVRVIDPTALPPRIVTRLAEAFDHLCAASRGSDEFETLRTRIDAFLTDVWPVIRQRC